VSETTPRLELPLIGDHTQKHLVMNAGLMRLESLVQARVLSRTLTAQPASPADGDSYILPSGRTGAVWGSLIAGTFVRAEGGTWETEGFPEGAIIRVADEAAFVVRTASGWEAFEASIHSLDSLDHLGIGTMADTTNVLAVKGPAVLISARSVAEGGSGDATLAISKETDSDTAQILLQKDFSTRALLGLLGDNNLSLKVSPNGSTFTQALSINNATGVTTLSGLTLKDAALILQDDADATKQASFELSGITPATTRTYTLPNVTGTLATTGNLSQTFSGTTIFSGPTASFGTSTAAATYGLGSGATTGAATKTVNIGTAGLSGSVTNITLGSAVGGATGTLNIYTPTVAFAASVTSLAAPAATMTGLYLGLGGAVPDATNRLSVATPAVLLNHAGSSVQLKLNKNAAANTASVLLQDGFSGRSEFGLTGDDNTTLKVSPDGSTWTTAFSVDRSTAKVSPRWGIQPPVWPMKSLLGSGGKRLGPLGVATTTNSAITANRLYMMPVMIPYDMTAVALALRVTTGAAGNARMGLYADNQGNPGSLLLDAGAVDTATAGLLELTLSQPLVAGVYWLAVVFSAAPTVNAHTGAGGAMGRDSASVTSVPIAGYYRGFTYAALPADESGQVYTATSTIVPTLMVG